MLRWSMVFGVMRMLVTQKTLMHAHEGFFVGSLLGSRVAGAA